MSIVTDPSGLRAQIFESLPAEARSLVERLIAGAAPAPVYVAAGALRDAMLGREPRDLDLVVEADAIAVARAAAKGTRVTAHKRFGTVTIKAGGVRVDVAMARSETYARPGALPKVAPADIETDLRRRDFTVNAMALQIDADTGLLDPCGGIEDLRARRIRVLHEASFRDDATRIFRALRYASRLGFEIEPETRGLLTRDIRYIGTIGGERLRHELELLLSECATAGLESAAAAGALHAIDAALEWDARRSHALRESPGTSKGTEFGFALAVANASTSDAARVVARLKLKRDEAAAVIGVAALKEAAPLLARPNVKPSGAVQILERYTDAAVCAFAAMHGSGAAGQIAQRYLEQWSMVKPQLTAGDLIALGVPKGPRISQALQLLRAARLDEIALDEDDERKLVARFVGAIRDSAAMNAPIELHANGH